MSKRNNGSRDLINESIHISKIPRNVSVIVLTTRRMERNLVFGSFFSQQILTTSRKALRDTAYKHIKAFLVVIWIFQISCVSRKLVGTVCFKDITQTKWDERLSSKHRFEVFAI